MPLGALKVRRGGSWELHMTPWQECGGMNAVSLSGQSRVLWRRWEIRTNRKRGEHLTPRGTWTGDAEHQKLDRSSMGLRTPLSQRLTLRAVLPYSLEMAHPAGPAASPQRGWAQLG